MQQKFWKLEGTELASSLATDLEKGLAAGDAQKRIEQYGRNQIQEGEGPGPWALFFGQFKNFIIWVLIGAALVSGLLREWVDTLTIIGIVILNAILGFIQEFRAEKALAALKRMASPTSRVIRDGQHLVVPSADLVPGDLIELEAGDKVPADCRLIATTANFSSQEASLTGESTPVEKTSAVLAGDDIPLADRTNMVFMGTAIVSGRGRAIVAMTGMNTELGRIATMIQKIEKESTPLEKKIDEFGRLIVKICFVLVVLVFLLEWWRGGELMETFLTAVSLAVAAIPEGLPAVVTIALALGVHRMVKRHVLIRKLASVETLGCATVICSDKTGTLTKNEMTVQALYAGGQLYRVTGVGYAPKGEIQLEGRSIDVAEHPDLVNSLACGVLCNGARLIEGKSGHEIAGDPTEGALLTAAAKAGLWKSELETQSAYVEELPFDSDRKMMSVTRRHPQGSLTAYVKGAPDILLGHCVFMDVHGKRREMTSADREQILKINADLAQEAMRVLALARRDFEREPDKYNVETIERKLTFLGLVAMIDPPRQEVKEAVRECRTAGIRAVMITGDHKNTAVAVARELGLYAEGDLALTGEELDRQPDDWLEQNVSHIPVYARVSPEHKLRIVRAWRERGDVVAMTGDGVNDAPAVKEADIGVAMGITGTDVTKEVSEMIVTDDNFASIVAAVEEGRGIYDNILKFVRYLLSCNAGEILVMFIASLVGWPPPLLPIHILWVNLVTDGLPALALGVDPVDRGVMNRPPRDPDEPVVGKANGLVLVAQGAFIAFCTLVAFVFVRNLEGETLSQARTAAFMVLSCSQLFHAFNCRSPTRSIFSLGIFSNMKLVYAVLVSLALQVVITNLPFAHAIFRTEYLSLMDWVMILALSSFPLWAMEIMKLLNAIRNRRES